ncbi:protein of unknown function [Azospirillum baldaniorum]|uniref:Uncharacterized protein n=1 Tax=Azospirillum baldaniorum TaxID=1064539 RepID=A0A9P1JNP7_9PROT|nr:protein of unknown function [Azospirillum baldaniorum]
MMTAHTSPFAPVVKAGRLNGS